MVGEKTVIIAFSSSQPLSLTGIGYRGHEQQVLLCGEEFPRRLRFSNAESSLLQCFKREDLKEVNRSIGITDRECQHFVPKGILEHLGDVSFFTQREKGKDGVGPCIQVAGKQRSATFAVLFMKIPCSLCSDGTAKSPLCFHGSIIA